MVPTAPSTADLLQQVLREAGAQEAEGGNVVAHLLRVAPDHLTLRTLFNAHLDRDQRSASGPLGPCFDAVDPGGAASQWLLAGPADRLVGASTETSEGEQGLSIVDPSASRDLRQAAVQSLLVGASTDAARQAESAVAAASAAQWRDAAELASAAAAVEAGRPLLAISAFEGHLRMAAVDPRRRVAALLAQRERRPRWLALAREALTAEQPEAAAFLYGCALREHVAIGRTSAGSPPLRALRQRLEQEENVDTVRRLIPALHAQSNDPMWNGRVSSIGATHLLRLGQPAEAKAEAARLGDWLPDPAPGLQQECGFC